MKFYETFELFYRVSLGLCVILFVMYVKQIPFKLDYS